MISCVRRSLLCLSIGLTTPVLAQQDQPPQSQYYIGEGEVDLYRGVYMHSRTDISVGPKGKSAELAFTRYYGVRQSGSGPFGSTSGHSLEYRVYRYQYIEEPNGPGQYSYIWYVVLGQGVETFDEAYGNNYISYTGSSPGTHIFTKSGGNANGPYTYTGPNGVVVNFGARVTCPNIGLLSQSTCGPATSVVQPDGTTLTFSYDTVSIGPRLRLVTNNFGYALGFEYTNSTQMLVSKVCAVNLANTYVTAASPCPAGARAATYNWPASGPITGAVDPSGQTTSYTYSGGTYGSIGAIRAPGSSSDDLTITYDPTTYKVSTLTYANGATWTYSYSENYPWNTAPYNYWTDVKTPLNYTTRHTFQGAPPPTSIVDPLNRTTTYQYNYISPTSQLPENVIQPEGNYTHYVYDSRGNATETRLVAKAGSGQADLVSTASFPATCADTKTCDKPDYVIDARGNRTDYTYSTGNGAVLTETGPAVNSVRPQKRYVYAQRYAWIKNSGGAYVQAATPVWLLSEEHICKTTSASGAGCSGGASDEVITAYDYGANSGPNNLSLKGVVVDSGGLNLRTCYSYDDSGNRISETQPKAGLTSCP